MIKDNLGMYPIRMMCRLMSVSSSGYYDWATRKPSKRLIENNRLAEKIKAAFDKQKSRAGAIRITKRLQADGEIIGRHRVARIMRKNDLRARAAKKYKATTNSNHSMPVAPNLLEQYFEATHPNEKWVSDITYIATDEGWLYLAVVLDLYSRKVIGWCMSERMTKQLVCDALMMALWNRKMPRNVILHSDRGSQYCSYRYQNIIKKHGLVCSMSKRGDCYDNAAMESWNHSFKVESIHGERFSTRKQAKSHIFEYIEIYYNRERLHSKLGYVSPEYFEATKVA
jgi:transposase InsO family protein